MWRWYLTKWIKTNWNKNNKRTIILLFSSRISELQILVNISAVNIRSIAKIVSHKWTTTIVIRYFGDIINYSIDVCLWFNQSLCTQFSHIQHISQQILNKTFEVLCFRMLNIWLNQT